MPAVSKYHLANVQAIQTLQPQVRALFYEFIVRLAVAGIRIRITAAKRTIGEQNLLYTQGRTLPGAIVTYVQGNDSWHVWGCAIDIAPLVRTWGFWYKVDTSPDIYKKMADIAKQIGIEWGYALWGFDQPHYQWTGGKTLDDMKNGSTLPTPIFERCYPTLTPSVQAFLVAQRRNLVQAGIIFPL